MMQDTRWGLVLCGGGALGAYQIGAWRALRRLGFDSFAGISGASVGALNAALWAAGDYPTALRAWKGIKWADFVTPSGTPDRIASREGLRRIIRSELDCQAVRESRIPVYASILSAGHLQVEYRHLDGCSEEEIEALLLATSSIPVIYGKSEVGQRLYWDGGFAMWGDNAPWKPLYENHGIRQFLVIELYDRENTFVPADCRCIRIHPSRSLGILLDFGQDSIMQRMEQGCRDTLSVLAGVRLMPAPEKALRSAIHSAAEMEQFFPYCQYPNAVMRVTDAGIFWDEICELYGFRLQRNRKFMNYRILDRKSIRRAWWLSQAHLMEDVERFTSANIKA